MWIHDLDDYFSVADTSYRKSLQGFPIRKQRMVQSDNVYLLFICC